MKSQVVYFVLPPRTLLLDLAGPAEALSMANRYQKEVSFELRYAGPAVSIHSSIGLWLTGITPLPKKIEQDAMIVVAGSSHVAEKETGNDDIVQWLKHVAVSTRRLVFICSGALLAGKAGLLNDRYCTTHHSDCNGLREIAPHARVLDNRIYVVDGNVYTSAGVTAGVDLILHLISEIAGPMCAVAVARNMVVYLRRTGADPQLSPWLDSRNHIHPVIHRVQDAIASDPARSWSLRQLSTMAHSSPRHVTRLFQLHTGITPVTYMNRLRVDLARQLLTNSQFGLDVVAERAGFRSVRHFRRVWAEYNNLSPGRWRTSYQQSV